MLLLLPALIQGPVQESGGAEYDAGNLLLIQAFKGAKKDPMEGLRLLRASADKGFIRAMKDLRRAFPKTGDPSEDPALWYRRLTTSVDWKIVEALWRQGAWRRILTTSEPEDPVELPQSALRPAKSVAGGAYGGVVGGVPGGTGKVVELNFSSVKVRYQPSKLTYPIKAKILGIQGLVVMELTINPEGEVVNVIAKEGPEELREGAIAYAKQWTFEPQMINGKPQFARFQLRVTFKLEGSKGNGN